MANIFKSKYTGEQIEEILDKSNNVTDITPNPTGEATEELTKIGIGGNIFSISGGGQNDKAYRHSTILQYQHEVVGNVNFTFYSFSSNSKPFKTGAHLPIGLMGLVDGFKVNPIDDDYNLRSSFGVTAGSAQIYIFGKPEGETYVKSYLRTVQVVSDQVNEVFPYE